MRRGKTGSSWRKKSAASPWPRVRVLAYDHWQCVWGVDESDTAHHLPFNVVGSRHAHMPAYEDMCMYILWSFAVRPRRVETPV